MNKLLIIIFFFISFALNAQLTTTWNSGCYYNQYQPEDIAGPCGHCYVSSTAVAMGQLMKYWQHPNKGWGSMSFTPYLYGTQSANFEHNYNWSLMPNDITSQNSEIARLLSDCEVSTTTNYSPYFYNYSCGLVNLDTVKIALHEHFGYKEGHVIYRNTDQSFDDKIINELNQNRPVMMEIYPYNNQCSKFCVIDDYNPTNQKFHINWGSGSGWNMWSKLDTISYSMVNWGMNTIALIGIEPDTITVTINTKYDGTNNFIPAHLFIGGIEYVSPYGSRTINFKKGWYDVVNVHTLQPWGNVNSTDALLIMKHYVGMLTLTGLKKDCANVTNDNAVNSLDALIITRRFTQVINSFTVGDWKFQTSQINNSSVITIYGRCFGDVN